MHTPRLAYCSPINPAASGISDYSEELLPYLAQYADVTLFVEDGLKPSNAQLTAHMDVQPISRLAKVQQRTPFDGIVYHMGNSPAHAGIWTMAQKLPGVMVLHDVVLHHFMLWYAATVQKNLNAYVTHMERTYGAAGAQMAQLMIRSRFTDATFDFPCNEPVIAAARGIMTHSHFAQTQVLSVRPDLPTAVVPMGVPLPPVIERNVARQRLGLPEDAFILASFGHINAYKRIEPALRALVELRREHHDVRYILVGSVSPNYNLTGVIERMGVGNAVQVTGYVSRGAFEDYVAASDICVNLRYPTAGETSASLLRLLGAARPTLVSATGAFTELPAGVVAQVEVDSSEMELFLSYCRLLMRDPALAATMGEGARAFVAREHTLDQAAVGYVRFLAKLYGWQVVRRIRETPLWDIAAPPASTPSATPAAQTPPTQPTAPVPPLVTTVAQAIGDLGVNDHGERLITKVAGMIADLE